MTSDSRTIRLADANLANHAGYAVIYHLWQAQKEGAGWASAITENAVMENSCKIGLVHAGSLPVRITHMERHNTTKEVMIAGEKEMSSYWHRHQAQIILLSMTLDCLSFAPEMFLS